MSVCPEITHTFRLVETHYSAHYKASHSEQMHQELEKALISQAIWNT